MDCLIESLIDNAVDIITSIATLTLSYLLYKVTKRNSDNQLKFEESNLKLALFDKYNTIYSTYKRLYAKISDSSNLCYKICDDRNCCNNIIEDYNDLGTELKSLNIELLFKDDLLSNLKEANDCYNEFLKSFLKFMDAILSMNDDEWTNFNLFLQDQYLWKELSETYDLKEDLKTLVNCFNKMSDILFRENTLQKLEQQINLYSIEVEETDKNFNK